jgi:histone H3/H4
LRWWWQPEVHASKNAERVGQQRLVRTVDKERVRLHACAYTYKTRQRIACSILARSMHNATHARQHI